MSAIQFIGTTPKDLIKQIKEEVIPQLKAELSSEFQPKEPTKYLTRNEVCELLKIDLSTLWRWYQKEGKLTAYGIGHRIYFKRSEIDDFINQNVIKSKK